MTTAHVFIATSLDGYIARTDGEIDWLLKSGDSNEDHGYSSFIADKELVVMGRGTYEKVLSFDSWPYTVPVIVLSKQLAESPVPEALTGKLRFSAQEPRDLMEELTLQGIRQIYVDGGQLVQSFMRDKLIADMVITKVPVLIGSGRSLFGSLPSDIYLRLVSNRSFPSGLVQSTYRLAT
jgi:dihydrofolate reductase